jgi:hypothetical protein
MIPDVSGATEIVGIGLAGSQGVRPLTLKAPGYLQDGHGLRRPPADPS